MNYSVPHTNPLRRQYLLQALPGGALPFVNRLQAAIGYVDATNTLGLGTEAVLTRADVRRQHRGYYLVRLNYSTAAGKPTQDMSDVLGPLATLAPYPREAPTGFTGPWPPPDEARWHRLLDQLANSADDATGTKLDGTVRPGRSQAPVQTSALKPT